MDEREMGYSPVDHAFDGTIEKITKKIIAYRGDAGACWFYRIHLPMSFLIRRHHEYGVMVAFGLSKDQYGKFDAAIFQRQHKQIVYDSAIELRRNGRIRLIYEIDDDIFNVPDWNPAYQEFGKRKTQDQIKKFLELVDAVWVTTDALKDLYSEYNDNIYVLPNSIALEAHTPSPNNSAKKVVCWQGSKTHDHDLKLLSKHVARLIKDPDVFVKIWGSLDFPGAYTVPAVDFQAFHAVLSQVDACIGLAPLVPVKFNLSKSNLKFLEYSIQGAVTIASNYGPYADTIVSGETGLLISNNNDWYDVIRNLLDNDDLRCKMAQNALDVVKEKYDLSKNYILWKTALDEVMAKEPKKGAPRAYF